MEIEELRWDDVDQTQLAQDQCTVEGCFDHGNESSGFIKSGEFFLNI